MNGMIGKKYIENIRDSGVCANIASLIHIRLVSYISKECTILL